MAKLNVAPTKSNYLVLKRQLAFAEEGYDLLDQKRQILVFELMSRLGRARDFERRVAEAMAEAYAALRESLLRSGRRASTGPPSPCGPSTRSRSRRRRSWACAFRA